MGMKTLPAAVAVLTLLTSSPALAGETVVSCGPGQRAIVSNERVGGEHLTRISCEGSGYRQVSSRARYEARHRAQKRNTALVIAGSAATGAGIGGIVRGGKGALIGAAIGGGAASLVEGIRRR